MRELLLLICIPIRFDFEERLGVKVGEFTDICANDEGGLLVEFIYGSLSEAIYSIGLYLGVGIEHWENFNRSGNYPSPPGSVDFLSSGTLLERNLGMGVVEFPTGWLEKRIPSTYWREIAGEQK